MSAALCLAERQCEECGSVYSPSAHHQRFCAQRCKWRWESRCSPRKIHANRLKLARRHETERGAPASPNYWARSAPMIGRYLPGGAVSVSVSPRPRWAMQLKNTRALHGMITNIVDLPHDPRAPFTIIPTHQGVGWGVHFADTETAARLAATRSTGHLYDQAVDVSFGPLVRIKAPVVRRRGRRRLRVDFITPVHIRTDASKRTHLYPTNGNLHSTLSDWLAHRVGATIAPEEVALRIEYRATQVDRVYMGSKYKVIAGFTGHVIVETNATGEWLLRCAETLGLGGKTAFGMGRIKLSGEHDF